MTMNTLKSPNTLVMM